MRVDDLIRELEGFRELYGNFVVCGVRPAEPATEDGRRYKVPVEDLTVEDSQWSKTVVLESGDE